MIKCRLSSLACEKKFLDDLGRKLEIRKLEDWYAVKSNEFVKNRRSRLLLKYNNSRLHLLRTHYPNHKWHSHLFQPICYGRWRLLQNQRAFVDWLGSKLGLNKMEDWYSVTREMIAKAGGGGILAKYNNSPSALLQAVYKEHNWIVWKFETVPKGYWASADFDVPKFVNWVAFLLKINSLDDWYRIAFSQIAAVIPLTIFRRYPLKDMLLQTYSNHPWDLHKLTFKTGIIRASQRFLSRLISEIFPSSGYLGHITLLNIQMCWRTIDIINFEGWIQKRPWNWMFIYPKKN